MWSIKNSCQLYVVYIDKYQVNPVLGSVYFVSRKVLYDSPNLTSIRAHNNILKTSLTSYITVYWSILTLLKTFTLFSTKTEGTNTEYLN